MRKLKSIAIANVWIIGSVTGLLAAYTIKKYDYKKEEY
jgi:hypothetical protein